MKKRNVVKKLVAMVLGISLIGSILTGCGTKKEEANAGVVQEDSKEAAVVEESKVESENTAVSGDDATTGDVKKLVFAYTATGIPYTYTDESGKATGSDIEILRIIDEKLPEYEFEFVATSYDDIYIGLQAGTYDAGLTNSFYTKERDEKYLIPTENLGGSLAGLLVRKEDAAVVTLEDVFAKNLKLVPMKAGDGMTYQIESYNEKNPDKQIPIEYTSDVGQTAQNIQWVAEGRYDVSSTLKTSYESTVVAEDGACHQFNDQLSFTVYKTVKTYPMFSRATLDEAFVTLFTDTLKGLKEDGTAGKIATEFYGEDIFKYTYTEGR